MDLERNTSRIRKEDYLSLDILIEKVNLKFIFSTLDI